ncbi:MAG: hypothetical protein GVY26_00175, partial [Bacteroidetes bacterium]|nr:hypothetical protein [Bacteroidota bacterium]
MKLLYTTLTLIILCSSSALYAQIEVKSNLPEGSCFCEGTPQQPFTVTAEGSAAPFFFVWSAPNGY